MILSLLNKKSRSNFTTQFLRWDTLAFQAHHVHFW